jgi:hypothetical protein
MKFKKIQTTIMKVMHNKGNNMVTKCNELC